jgi:hypothetical protein
LHGLFKIPNFEADCVDKKEVPCSCCTACCGRIDDEPYYCGPNTFLTIAFDSETAFFGPTEGSRLGTSVALIQEGTWMTALGVTGTGQAHNRQEGTDWTSQSTILVEESSSFSDDQAMDLASATDGSPMVAIASSTSFRVVQYTNGQWRSRGKTLIAWVSADGAVESIVLSSAIALSRNGQVFVAGSSTHDGVVMRIFE